MEKVFEIYIKTTPERLWEAITDTELRQQVQLRGRRRLRLDAGLALRGRRTPPRAIAISEGENLEVDPPRPPGPELQRALERRREGAKGPRG